VATSSFAPRRGKADKAAGLYLRHLRRRKGLSPEQLGAVAHVSGATVRAVEQLGRIPWDSTQKRIARVFDVESDDIWTVQRQL
jgi:transcriptional regulator with XRE-family HTH domain